MCVIFASSTVSAIYLLKPVKSRTMRDDTVSAARKLTGVVARELSGSGSIAGIEYKCNQRSDGESESCSPAIKDAHVQVLIA